MNIEMKNISTCETVVEYHNNIKQRYQPQAQYQQTVLDVMYSQFWGRNTNTSNTSKTLKVYVQ